MIQVDPGSCEEITLDSDEGALDVGIVNIGFGKPTRTLDMTTNKVFARIVFWKLVCRRLNPNCIVFWK